MSLHTGDGNYFDKMRLDYDAAFLELERIAPCCGKRTAEVRQPAWKNKLKLRLHNFLRRKKLFEALIQNGFIRHWFEEFNAFWSGFLNGRPLSIMDFHQLRFHYRLLFQETEPLDWTSAEQHMLNWKRHKIFYLLFGCLYSHALNPYRDLTFLNPAKPNRVLEYGCSHAPYYRALKTYYSHLAATWTLADIKNIAFMFSRYSYKDDSAIEQYIVIDENNLENPFPENNGFYDVIILTTVLEHVNDPLAVMLMLTANLRRGGQYCSTISNQKALDLIPQIDWSCGRKHFNS